jgi:hypothetical protein
LPKVACNVRGTSPKGGDDIRVNGQKTLVREGEEVETPKVRLHEDRPSQAIQGAVFDASQETGAFMRKETNMHGKPLLFASPLIAGLVFGPIGTSQASVVPPSISAGDSHVTATSKGAPPVCRSLDKDQMKICSNGYSEGFAAGAKCGQPLRRGKIFDDEAYDIGFTVGFKAGQRTCPTEP